MGIDFPFSLMNSRLHVRYVLGPFAPLVFLFIECICIRVDADAFELAQNHACDELLELGIIVNQGDVWPYLRARIPEPHRMDVSCIYEGIIFSYRMDRSVKRVRETVGKHPCQPVILKQLCHFLDLGLDCS